MDDVIINNFIISKESVMWNLDYDNPSTRTDITENQIFQNYMAGNKSTRIIMVSFIRNLISPVDDLISDLENGNQIILNKYTICVYYFVQNFSTNLSNLCNHIHKENPPIKMGDYSPIIDG